MEDNSDTDSVAELEYKTWDDARAWEFRNARGNTNVSLSQNSRMETNREYVSDVDTDIDSDADYGNVDVRWRMFLRRMFHRHWFKNQHRI